MVGGGREDGGGVGEVVIWDGLGMGDEGLQFTLDEAVSAIGFGNFQVFALVFAGFGWIALAMETMILSVIGPAVQSDWALTSGEESMLDTAILAGMLVGSNLWGLMADNYGRRKGFIGAIAVTAGAGLFCTFSPDYNSLLILLFLLGLGTGGVSIFAIWFLEFVPAPNRGTWMSVIATFWTLGTIFETLLAWIIVPRLGWRWLLAFSCLPSILVVLFAGLTPESPRYLCIKGKTTEAHGVLEKVARFNQKKLPPGRLAFDSLIKQDEETPLLSCAKEKSGDSDTIVSKLYALFSPSLVKTTLLVWILYFAIIFAYYGIIFMTTELRSAQSSCTSSTKPLGNAQDDTLYMGIFINSLAEVPALVLTAVIVDRVGRKLTMGITSVLSFIFLLPLVSHQNEMVTITSLFGARMFISATFTVANIYSKEVYPTSVRSTGAGIASFVGGISGVVCPFAIVGLIRGCHQTSTIILFEVVLALLMLCIPFLPFEPNGKDLIDVVRD